MKEGIFINAIRQLLKDGYHEFEEHLQSAYRAINRYQRERNNENRKDEMTASIEATTSYLSQFKPYIPRYKQRYFDILEHHRELELSTRDLIMTFDRAVFELHTRLEQDHQLTDDLGNWSPLMKDLLNSRREIQEIARRPQDSFSSFVAAGVSVVAGVVTGPVYKVSTAEDWDNVPSGSIVVAKMTTPDVILAIDRILGMATEQGGQFCHASIIAREYNLPCIVGCGKFLTELENGEEIVLDAAAGIILKAQNE